MASIILFHNTRNIFSKIIELFENSPISHSAIGIDVNGVPYILHACWSGVVFAPQSDIMNNHTVVAQFEIIPDISNEIELAKKKIGEPYDTIGLLGYIPVFIAKWFGIGIHNPLASKSAVVCSEFIIEVDENHEISEFVGLDPADVSPKDLFDMCSKGKSFKRII